MNLEFRHFRLGGFMHAGNPPPGRRGGSIVLLKQL